MLQRAQSRPILSDWPSLSSMACRRGARRHHSTTLCCGTCNARRALGPGDAGVPGWRHAHRQFAGFAGIRACTSLSWRMAYLAPCEQGQRRAHANRHPARVETHPPAGGDRPGGARFDAAPGWRLACGAALALFAPDQVQVIPSTPRDAQADRAANQRTAVRMVPPKYTGVARSRARRASCRCRRTAASNGALREPAGRHADRTERWPVAGDRSRLRALDRHRIDLLALARRALQPARDARPAAANHGHGAREMVQDSAPMPNSAAIAVACATITRCGVRPCT